MKAEELLHYSLNVRIVKWCFRSRGEPEELQGEGKVNSYGTKKFLQTVKTFFYIYTYVFRLYNIFPQQYVSETFALKGPVHVHYRFSSL